MSRCDFIPLSAIKRLGHTDMKAMLMMCNRAIYLQFTDVDGLPSASDFHNRIQKLAP